MWQLRSRCVSSHHNTIQVSIILAKTTEISCFQLFSADLDLAVTLGFPYQPLCYPCNLTVTDSVRV